MKQTARQLRKRAVFGRCGAFSTPQRNTNNSNNNNKKKGAQGPSAPVLLSIMTFFFPLSSSFLSVSVRV